MAQRIDLNTAAPAVKKFLRGLPIDAEGIELVLAGRVLCKVIPALQFSEAEKAALLKERRDLIRSAQARNKGVPARVIAKEVREALKSPPGER